MRKVYNFNTKWAFSKDASEAPKEMEEMIFIGELLSMQKN